MTTTTIVRAHGWPVLVTTTDTYVSGNSRSKTITTERVERYTEREVAIHGNRSVAYEELTSEGHQPKDVDQMELPDPSRPEVAGCKPMRGDRASNHFVDEAAFMDRPQGQ